MTKSLFNKHLSYNLLPFCFRLCPTASGDGMEKRKQPEAIGHKSDTGLGLSPFVIMGCVFASVILPEVSKYVF